MDFCHFEEIYLTNMEKSYWTLIRCQNKLGVLKTATEKVAHKAAEETGEVIGNRIANRIVKIKPVPDVNSRSFEEIFIPPEKRE